MNHKINVVLIIALLLSVSCKNKTELVGNIDEVKQIEAIDKAQDALKIEIYDAEALNLIDVEATFEILAEGFYWSEGPLWIDDLQSVVFSDVPANKIYQWNERDGISVFLNSAGHSGAENIDSRRGPNGLMLDADNNLIICQHGDRRIAKLDSDLKNPQSNFMTIADNYKGKKFNSPNDLAIDNKGNMYFTDPPYGLTDYKTGEIGINGVFKVTSEKEVILLVDSLSMPNGIALSLDYKKLYVNQSNPNQPVMYNYEISEDGSLKAGKMLFDFSEFSKNMKGLPDGLKIHKTGNIFSTGPGGVHIISPEGKQLALIKTGKSTANCAFDINQRYLYMTTTDQLIRVKLK